MVAKTGAWYGEPHLKAAAIARLREHRRLEQLGNLSQGFGYFAVNEGCQLGCLTHTSTQEGCIGAMQRMFAIPPVVSCWLEAIFEHVGNDYSSDWAIESTEAIPVGADLDACVNEMFVWLGGDCERFYRDFGELALAVPIGLYQPYKECAVRSLEIFRAAPIITGQGIPQEVQRELCGKQLYCPTEELVRV